jgi:hypothetical protein
MVGGTPTRDRMLQTVKKYLLVLISDKDINPVDDCKAYEIQFDVVTKFIFSAHRMIIIQPKDKKI